MNTINNIITTYYRMDSALLQSENQLLTEGEEAEIFALLDYAKNNTDYVTTEAAGNALSRLCYANTKFIYSVLKNTFKVTSTHPDFADIVEEGRTGILEAAHKFDSARGIKFLTFAKFQIMERCGTYLRNNTRAINIPRSILDNIKCMREARERFISANDCEPTDEEVLEWSGLELEKFLEAKAFSTAVWDLDRRFGTKDDNHTLGDTVSSDTLTPEERFIRKAIITRVMELVEEADDVKQLILANHYGLVSEQLNQTEMAKRLGMARSSYQNLLDKYTSEVIEILTSEGLMGDSVCCLSRL